MIPYLLYVALLLAVCWVFYKLLLYKETFYRLNRWVLLGCLSISFGLPLFHVPQKWKLNRLVAVQPVKTIMPANTFNIKAATISANAEPKIPQQPLPVVMQAVKQSPHATLTISFSDAIKWLMIIYWAGAIIFSINLLIQLIITFYEAYSKEAIADHSYRIIELTGDKIPCSFLNTIFVNPEKYDWDTYSQILLHEKIHIGQLHSIDIFLAELAIIFQWFNPFAWALRKEIENNLEYLTDEEVLKDKTVDPSSYQMSLLKVSAPQLSLRITTNYNQSLLKKRIKMMNAKRSNIHILWKYFMLLPLFGGLACALNQPAVGKQLTIKTNNNIIFRNNAVTDTPSYAGTSGKVEGLWFATRKNDTIDMEFKSSTKNHNWNDGGNFGINEFSSIPNGKKGTFTVTRDAGTMVLNGSFDEDEGVGHFKFTPNEKYITYLSTIQQGKFDEHDVMSLMSADVSKEFLRSAAENGYSNINASFYGALKYFNVTAADLHYWKHSGIKGLTAQELLSLKIDKIDSNFVRSIEKLGYTNITFGQLNSLKHEKITPEYIKEMQQAKRAGTHGDSVSTGRDLSEIIDAKFENLDSTYIRSIEAAGYDLTQQQLFQFKRAGVTADLIKELKQLGYAPSYNELISYKASGITPEFIKSFNAIGYDRIDFNELIALKYQNITPGYLKSFESLGYKNLPLSIMLSFKRQNITAQYITGFNKLGFNNIPADDLIMLKMSNVTPQYVSSMKQKGLVSTDLRKYLTLKTSFKDSE